MDPVLLATKLFIPKARPAQVSRPRLSELISKALDFPLTLISAPAGYGKTTLVSSWLETVGVPSAWFSLDEEDNDPSRFLQYLLKAFQDLMPGSSLQNLAVLHERDFSVTNPVLGSIINQAAGVEGPFLLVLDDVHVIQNQAVLDLIAYLLAHHPPHLHLVLLTRMDPAFPLARYRARNQLLEIRQEQLRFTQAESDSYLTEVMGLRLNQEDNHALLLRTEGWIAGLQMAALSMQHNANPHQIIAAFTGSHAYILDYLTEEVLEKQAARSHAFLLRTSILERMCGDLCDAVCPPEEPGDAGGQAMLASLAQSNAFITSLDYERNWYRYHQLFADLLRRRLESETSGLVSELHRKASAWFERQGAITEAISHALKAKDREMAMRLFEQNGCQFLIRGETATLLKWIEALDPFPADRPWLSIQKAWTLTLSGRWVEAEPLLQQAESILSPLPLDFNVKTMLGIIEAARAEAAIFQGDANLAMAHAQNALSYLPEGDDFSCSMRSVTIEILGNAYWMEGDLNQAKEANRKAVEVGQVAHDRATVLMAKSGIAAILAEEGKYREAELAWREALHLAIQPDGQLSPLAGEILSGLGEIFYEWNQLEEARYFFRSSSEVCRTWGDKSLEILNAVWEARLEQLAGCEESAREAIRRAEDGFLAYPTTRIRSAQICAALGRWHLAQGNLERGSRWMIREGIPLDEVSSSSISNLQVPGYIVYLRGLWMQGKTRQALGLCERLLAKTNSTNHISQQIEVWVLQALVYQKMEDWPAAVAALEKGLSLGEEHGFLRTFIEEGEPIARLLCQVKKGSPMKSYAIALVKAMDRSPGEKDLRGQSLVEPLSEREQEVLRLIQQGYSNQDIAGKLVISLGTVKRHISNIYAKLGVSSRTQAIGLAKELKLIK